MIDFKNRSPEKELLDSGGIPFPDIRKNMQELEFINSKLGGHSVTVSGVERMFRAHFSNDHSLPLTVCEIGCGGGDNLAAVCRWAKKSIDISCIGIDINLACIDFATEKNAEHPISFVCADYRKGLEGKARPDIIFSSLFCHHFSEDELVDMLQWMKGNAGTGFMINDLHRHPLAYFSIKILTGIFSNSYLVKNDAPISVLRGFKRNDWLRIFAKAGITSYTIKWMWAFRYLVIFTHK